jgi:hypothetical protein
MPGTARRRIDERAYLKRKPHRVRHRYERSQAGSGYPSFICLSIERSGQTAIRGHSHKILASSTRPGVSNLTDVFSATGGVTLYARSRSVTSHRSLDLSFHTRPVAHPFRGGFPLSILYRQNRHPLSHVIQNHRVPHAHLAEGRQPVGLVGSPPVADPHLPPPSLDSDPMNYHSRMHLFNEQAAHLSTKPTPSR